MSWADIFINVENKEFTVGSLFRAVGKSSAITTDPWGSTDRTITHADHVVIRTGDYVLLVERATMGDKADMWIWIHQEKVVWQVMRKTKFEKCWKQA